MNDYVEVEFELDEELIELIDEGAKAENLTRDEFVNKIIKNLIDNYEIE